MMFLSCKSPRTTNLHFSSSNDPSLFTFTLKVSITVVLISPFFSLPWAKVPESMRVFSSFFNGFQPFLPYHSAFTFSMSRIVLGAGSHELASVEVGCKSVCASAAHASTRLRSVQIFAHPTILATLAYFGLVLWRQAVLRGPAFESLLLASTINGAVVPLVESSKWLSFGVE
jgi:hypothetical protein